MNSCEYCRYFFLYALVALVCDSDLNPEGYRENRCVLHHIDAQHVTCAQFCTIGISFILLHQNNLHHNYYDITMGAMASQNTCLTIVYTTVFSGADQRKNIKAPRNWPLCREFTGDRWIPCTQMASNAENVSIWWRHHDICNYCHICVITTMVNTMIHLSIICFKVESFNFDWRFMFPKAVFVMISVC